MRTKFVSYKGKQYQLTFDDEAYLDTVFQVTKDKEPKQLNGQNAAVKVFVDAQTQIFNGMMLPTGLQIINQRDMFGFNLTQENK